MLRYGIISILNPTLVLLNQFFTITEKNMECMGLRQSWDLHPRPAECTKLPLYALSHARNSR
jgi:hypothetical protein